MLDITRNELDADPMAAYRNLHPEDIGPFFEAAAEAARLKRPFFNESRYIIRGAVRWYRLEAAERHLPDGLTVWDGAVIDITEHRQAEEAQRLKLSQKLKTSLKASAIAHEINQPLSRILLQSRLAASGGKTAKSALRLLVAEAEAVVATIEKMKVLLRNVETSHEWVSLPLVVKNSLRQLKQPIALHRIEIGQQGPRRGCSIQGDAVQLQLAVMNLLRNAIEAMAENQSRTRKISIELRKAPDSIQLVIGDSGPGWSGGSIEETLLQSSKPGGIGLGLYIVETAMENHSGQLEIGRSPLGGAEFRMIFPAETAL
jgi:C4-dicarboxylate-specific signal transduction histidine kinase